MCFPSFLDSPVDRRDQAKLATACVSAWTTSSSTNGGLPDPGPLHTDGHWCLYGTCRRSVEVQRTAARAKAISFTEAPHRLACPRSSQRTIGIRSWPPLRTPICLVSPLRERGAPEVAPDANFAVSIACSHEFASPAVDLLCRPCPQVPPPDVRCQRRDRLDALRARAARLHVGRHRWTPASHEIKGPRLFRDHIFGASSPTMSGSRSAT